MAWSTPSTRSTGDLITAAIWNQDVVNNPIALTSSVIAMILDGGGATIGAGIQGDIEVPFKCDLERVTLLADQTGDIKVDIWKDTYANYPPDNADTITGGNEPEISSAVKDQDAALSGWTTAVAAGDILRYNVDSATNIERCLVSLKVAKS